MADGAAPTLRLAVGVVLWLLVTVDMAVCEGVCVLETVMLRVDVAVAVCDALAPGDRLVVADAVGCGQKHMGR